MVTPAGIEAWRELAGGYDAWFATAQGAWMAARQLEALGRVLEPLGAEARVLEVGAGTGQVARALAGRGWRVAALEPSAAMLAAARRAGSSPRVAWLRGVAERLPMARGTCDAAVFFTSLEFVGDPGAALAEALRALRPGGLLVVGFLDVASAWAAEYRAAADRGEPPWAAARFFALEELETLARAEAEWADGAVYFAPGADEPFEAADAEGRRARQRAGADCRALEEAMTIRATIGVYPMRQQSDEAITGAIAALSASDAAHADGARRGAGRRLGRAPGGIRGGLGLRPAGSDDHGFERLRLSTGQRLKQLDETVQLLRRMWGDEPEVSFEGRFVRAERVVCEPKPPRRVPILVGGAGEKVTMRIAAQHADMWNNLAGYQGVLAEKVAALRGHLEAAGRAPDSMTISQQCLVTIAPDEASAGPMIETAKKIFGGHMGDPAGPLALAGSPARVREQIQKHVDLGCTMFVMEFFGRDTKVSAKLFADTVLPHFK